MLLRLDDEYAEDHRLFQYCDSRNRNRIFRYNANLHTWWEADQFVALVMPSSGATEQVFSLASNHVSQTQTCILSDALLLGLFLGYK